MYTATILKKEVVPFHSTVDNFLIFIAPTSFENLTSKNLGVRRFLNTKDS
jgi:hypothetical protein